MIITINKERARSALPQIYINVDLRFVRDLERVLAERATFGNPN